MGCAYSTSTPRVAFGCRKQIIPAESLARFLIDERDTLRARGFQLGIDAVALEAYVMQSAAAPREEFSHAAIGIDRLEQFDLAPARIEQRGLDALIAMVALLMNSSPSVSRQNLSPSSRFGTTTPT